MELGNHQWTLKLEGKSLMRSRILISIYHSINYKYKRENNNFTMEKPGGHYLKLASLILG